MLVFGLVMMVMMVVRPQGLWPARGQRFSLGH
jgi:branched-chain amino acid transport system permease protein